MAAVFDHIVVLRVRIEIEERFKTGKVNIYRRFFEFPDLAKIQHSLPFVCL